ncbi:MAG: UDP-3-O-(3-hydroxymyristoyl)glucosamine N-acyltransferase [Sphingobacteriia bacterium]|nr:UDP-3-O-(3-hydroxymyristoyl)glucosamine N-acyltransferase [Sphingobacteriia bacterium]
MNSDFFNINLHIPASKIAELLQIEVDYNGGNENHIFDNTASLKNADSNKVSFFINKKYVNELSNTQAGAILISKDYISYAPKKCILFITPNPYFHYAKLLEYFYQAKHVPSAKIEPTAFVAKSAIIGRGTYIGHNAVIEEEVEIGENCFIDSNVVIKNNCKIGNSTRIYSGTCIQYSIIGDRCSIHPNVSIGQDGFGYSFHLGSHYKVPQVGRVIINNDVEIGANTTIDRGSANDTIIGEGTKIDNLVQIAHNVITGKHCIIVSMTGIAGSTILGDYVITGGQSGFAGHLKIGNRVQVAAQSGVMKDIPDGMTVGGSPAVPVKDWHRQTLAVSKLIKKAGQND